MQRASKAGGKIVCNIHIPWPEPLKLISRRSFHLVRLSDRAIWSIFPASCLFVSGRRCLNVTAGVIEHYLRSCVVRRVKFCSYLSRADLGFAGNIGARRQ